MERRVYKGPLGEKIVASQHQTGTFRKPTLVGIITVDGEVRTVNTFETEVTASHGFGHLRDDHAMAASELFNAQEKLNDWIDRWMRHMYNGDMAF